MQTTKQNTLHKLDVYLIVNNNGIYKSFLMTHGKQFNYHVTDYLSTLRSGGQMWLVTIGTGQLRGYARQDRGLLYSSAIHWTITVRESITIPFIIW